MSTFDSGMSVDTGLSLRWVRARKSLVGRKEVSKVRIRGRYDFAMLSSSNADSLTLGSRDPEHPGGLRLVFNVDDSEAHSKRPGPEAPSPRAPCTVHPRSHHRIHLRIRT